MDEDLKKKTQVAESNMSTSGHPVDNQKRLEMYRKLRKDLDNENKQEKEAAYQKRVE